MILIYAMMDIYLFIVVDKDKTTFNDIHFADTTQNIFFVFLLNSIIKWQEEENFHSFQYNEYIYQVTGIRSYCLSFGFE